MRATRYRVTRTSAARSSRSTRGSPYRQPIFAYAARTSIRTRSSAAVRKHVIARKPAHDAAHGRALGTVFDLARGGSDMCVPHDGLDASGWQETPTSLEDFGSRISKARISRA